MAHFQQLLAIKPFPFTYLAIGSNPHAATLEALNDFWDQLMPCFLRETLSTTKVRAIHFDPAFEYNMEFIQQYFATKYVALTYMPKTEDRPYHSWTSPKLEVLVLTERFDHETDDWFLDELSEKVLARRGKLVVQEYSGQRLTKTLQSVFEKTSNPEAFKKNILFDITYGEASCMTDMSSTKPIYDKAGDFVNISLFTAEDMLCSVGISLELDARIKAFFVKKFKSVLNNHHVNYRRRMMGDTCLFQDSRYDKESGEPILIMQVLQKELYEMFNIFERLNLIDFEKSVLIENLMLKYASYDMYDWYSRVNKLFV